MAGRKEITETIINSLEKVPYAHALWQGGAAAFNRLDEWSDIDIGLIVEDGREQDAMLIIRTCLETSYGIDLEFVIDPPQWPDMVQSFFRLKDTSPFLMVDVSVLPSNAKSKFLEPEIHGRAILHFDKTNVMATVPAVDESELRAKLRRRIAMHKLRYDIFRVLVDKEINRKSDVDAFIFYFGYTLSPLVEMLRIKHSIHHWNFGARYLKYDLPADIAANLQPFYFVKDLNDLKEKNERAREMFWKAADEAETAIS